MKTSPTNHSIPERLIRTLRLPIWKKSVSSILLAQFAFWSVQVRGANFTWDGGTNPWDTTSSFWNTSSATWANTFNDIAIFGGTAGTVTLAGPINAGGITFNSNGYLVTGSTLTLGAPTGSTSPVLSVNNNGFGTNQATISSILAGASGLTKVGNGALRLTNNANTFSGDLAIKAGTLVISDVGQLGTGTTAISVTGVAQTGNPGYTGGALVLQGSSVSAASSGLTLNREVSVAGRGPGSVNATGALVSIGYNTLAGGLTLTSASGESRAWATHGITTVSGDVFLGAGGGNILYGNGNWNITGRVAGLDTSQDRFIKTGNMAGTTLWLQNAGNTFAQTIRIDSGSVRVSDNGALGTSISARAIDFNSGFLELHSDAPNFSTRNIFNRAVTGTVVASRALGSSAINQTFQLGNLNMDNGTFNARGRNGAAIIINGSTGAGTDMSWGGAGSAAFTNDGSGLFTFNGNVRKNEATARDFTIASNGDTTISGNYLGVGGGAHRLVKRGTGIFALGGSAGTYTGATAIQQGTMSISSFGGLNTSSTANIEIGGPGGTNLPAQTVTATLKYTGAAESSSRNFSLVGTTGGAILLSSGTGPLTLSGNFSSTGAGIKTLTLGGTNAGLNAISGIINDNSGTNITSVTKIGAGTWQLSGANTFTGSTSVTNGTLKIQDVFSGTSRNVLPDAGAIVFNSHAFSNSAGGIFEYLGDAANASTETVGALTPTAGAGTVKVTAGAGGTAALTFASLGTVSAGSGINFVTNAGGSVAFTTAANTNGILNAHLFYNGADFAAGTAVGAATYTVESAGAALVGGNTTPYHVTTTDIASQTTATINAGIKFSDTRNLTLGAAQTLTLQNGAATVSGGILVTGGSTVTISGGTGITTGGAADLVFRTNGSSDVLNLNTPITSSSTGGWTKLGAGTLVLGANNAGTTAGQVHINEGTVRLGIAGADLGADSMDVRLRQGATLDLNGFSLGTVASGTGSIDELNGAGTVTNSTASTNSALRLGNANGNGYFTGAISDGAGTVSLVKNGSGTFRLAGPQNFSGGVTISAGTFAVNSLADFGSNSGLGKGITGNNAGSLVFNGGTLSYTGADGTFFQETTTPSVSINREFTLAGAGRIDSNGRQGSNNVDNNRNDAALIFNSTNAISFSGTGTRTLTLAGDSLGDNELKMQLTNNLLDASPTTTGALTFVKDGSGLWILGNSGNAYNGPTVITAGALRAEGTALPSTSALRLNGGVFQSSGTFTRAIGTGAGQVAWSDAAGTATNRNGGFAASISKLTVNVGGAAATLNWGAGGIGNGTGSLILNSSTSWADVELVNGINLNGANRTITVDDNGNTGLDFATISGVISNSTGAFGFTKNGGGVLILGNANTYNGNTTISDGTLVVSSIGAAGATSSSLGTNVTGGNLILNRGNADFNALIYVGQGETATRPWSLASTGLTANRTWRIDSSGSGALVLSGTFANTMAGDAAGRTLVLELRGANTDNNMITSQLINSTNGTNPMLLAISKTDGGTWVLAPSVANTFTSSISVNSGNLGLTTNGIGSASGITISNGGIFGYGGALNTSKVISISSNNATAVFTGENSITFGPGTGTALNINSQGNANSATISNNIVGGSLTINGDIANLESSANLKPFIIGGMGSTIINGAILNGTNGLRVQIQTPGTVTYDGASAHTYTGTTTLQQGTLVLSKTLGVSQFGASSAFNFNGGVLTTDAGSLTGGNAISTPVTLGGDPATISGSNSFEFITGTLTNSGGDRHLLNELSGGATLTISGPVSLSNDATNRTLTVRGAGSTTISGVIGNGGTATASALNKRGTGTLTLTNANTFDGATTVANGVLILSGNGTLDTASTTAVTTVLGAGTLRLDNSGTNLANRIVDTAALDLNLDGGLLDFIGDGTASSETFGRLDINSNGLARINITGAGTNTLTFASVNFANSGSALDLSQISSLGTNNKVIFTTAPTGIAVSNGVLSRVVLGSNFAEYNATNGVQAFSTYNTSSSLITPANTDTVDLTASANIGTSRILNALRLNDATGFTVGSTLDCSTLTLTSGGLIASGGGTHTLSVPFVNTGANGGFFQVTTGTTLDVNSSLTGGAFTKLQAGALNFNGKQFYTSTTNIHGGTVTLDGGLNTILPTKQVLILGTGATLDLNSNVQFIGNLNSVSDQPGAGGSILGGGTLVTDGGGTWMGTVSSGTNLGRIGGGTLTIGSAQTYSGWTFLAGGTTTLRDDGTLINTSGIDINGATLAIRNNDSLQIQNNNRISDAAAINLRAGTIDYAGRVHANATETFGAVSALMGANTITATNGGTGTGGVTATTDLSFASINRSAGATINFTGSNLGQPGNNSRITATSGLTATGNGVLGAWAIANSTDYAAYNAGLGVGVVGQGGFVGYDSAFSAGLITQIPAPVAATTTTLSPGTTTTGLLRLVGAFTNNVAFTGGSDTLHLTLGGILRSNENQVSTIGTTSVRGNITSGTGELVVYNAANNAANAMVIHSVIQGAGTSFVKSGAGVLTLTAPNTYGGGTVVNQGTLQLGGDASVTVIPAGGLTLTGGTVTMLVNAGQIAPTNVVTLNGSSTLTLVGNNTLDSIAFNNIGGGAAPTVTTGGVLTLSNSTPISVVTPSGGAFQPIINGTINLGSGSKTINVGAISMNGVTYDDTINRALNIAAIITGTGPINKTGNGLLGLGGQSTFSGLTVSTGGIVLGANSSSTVPNSLVSGPLGLGSVSMASGTTLSVDDNSRTVANAVTFAGNPVFGNTGVTTDTLTLNGGLTFSTLAASGVVANVNTPYLNVVLGGPISGIGSVTSVGSGSGANTINKTGPGNISGINLTGLGAAVPVNINGLTATNAFSLLHDGNGTSGSETINLGTISWTPKDGQNIALTIGRAGTGIYFPTPTYKTIQLAGLTSSVLPNGISVTNNNNYGLIVPDAVALAATNTWTVSAANTSLIPAGLTLTGQITGTATLAKAGDGTLKLDNATNNFTGTINITNGTVEGATDTAFGNSANIIQIGSNSATEGLRISGSFATNRTIALNAAASGIDVTGSNTFTLNNAFTFATATNSLQKNDLGTLVLSAAQTGWDGNLIVNQGIVRISDGASLGSTTGNTQLGNVGATLELSHATGLTVADAIVVNSTNNSSSVGVNGAGAIRSVLGTNNLNGSITVATTTADANNRAVSITADSGSILNINGGIVLGLGTGGSNRDNWVGLGGAGTINVTTTALSQTGTLGVASLSKFGTGTLNIQVANAFALAQGQNVIIKQGTLSLNGAGTLGTSTTGAPGRVVLNPTGILEINNASSDVDNRLSGRNISVSGADINVIGNAAGTTETVGTFTLREGLSKITLDADASGALDFTTGALTRSAQATLLIRGDNFGSASGAGTATFTGSSYAYIGQVGNAGTTTKGILPWALGDTSLTGNGIGFVTSDTAASTGTTILRLLAPSEQASNFATALTNVNLTTTEVLSVANTYNSLRLDSGGGVDLNYVPLALDSGGLLVLSGHTGIDGFSGVSYLTTTSNREVIIHNNAALTLNVPIAATTGALTKSGNGILTLTAGNSNHGTVMVNDGTLKLGGGDHTILPGRNMWVNEGGTLDLNGTVQQVGILASRLTEVLARGDLFSANSGGNVINTSGSQATLAIATGETFTGTISGNIAVARATAAGNTTDWNLYSDNTYTGPTLFNGGRVQTLDFGRLSGTTAIELSNSSFLLTAGNASTEGSNITDRVNDAATISLRGAMLQMRSRAALYTTETFGAVTLGEGQSMIDFSEAGTAVNQVDATFTSLARTTADHGVLRFMNIDAQPSGLQRLFVTTLNGVATTNYGDGLTNNLIGGWATFEREFASYIPGQGVGGLNTQGFAGYSPALINDGISTDNIRIALPTAGSNTVLTANRSINSLAIIDPGSATGSSTLDLGGFTLTLGSGGFIASPITDTFSISITNGNLTAGALNVGGEFFFHGLQWVNNQADNTGNRDINLGANIVDNGTGAVTLVIGGNQGRGTAAATNDLFVTGNNTYTGGTWVNSGRIVLNNATADGVTVTATGTGDVNIAGGYSSNPSVFSDRNTQVVFGASDQIKNTATVTVMGGGTLNLNGFSQSLAGLMFDNHGGDTPLVATGAGTLTITGGSITASGQNIGSSSTITGALALGGGTTTITVNPVTWNSKVLNPFLSNLTINASISGTNINKAGNGVLSLGGSNAFTGTFDLQAGGLQLANNNALSTGALTIGNGTFLTSTADNRTVANAYTVSGNFSLKDAFNLTLSGLGTLTAGTHDIGVDLTQKTLTLSGVLSGATANINKVGDGILILSNTNNTYGGSTTVSDGILRYGAVNAVPVGSAVSVLEGGLLDITLGGTAVTVGSLASNTASTGGVVFHGAVTGTNTFTVGGDNSTTNFGGVIANGVGSTLNFVKTGSGTMTLGGANTYNGSTTVTNGRLIAQPVAGNSPLGTSQSLILGGGSTAGVLQLGNSTGALNHTFTSLASAGTATTNQIVSGNAAMATLTLNLASNSSFAGNIGGSGTNEANLNLVKSGSGDLSISGTGTSMYSGTTTVSGGKLFMDSAGAFPATTTSLTLADGTEFSLRGTTNNTVTGYGFGAGTGAKIVVGSTTGATLGFGLDGTGNSQLVLATGQTMNLTGTLTTAIYVNNAPTSGLQYVLIDGADANSLTGFGGTFNTSPVVFNGGSFTYALAFTSGVNGGGLNQWTLTPTAVAAAADTWWKGDLTGIAAGVWSASLSSGTGFPTNWDDSQSGGVDAVVPPDSGSIVHFSATGATNFATTLGANMTIQELIFHTGNAATTIGSSNGTNTLTIGNTVDTAGLTLQAGVGDVGISAIVALPQNQSWNIEDTARVLSLSGGLTGTNRTLTVNDTTTNSGTLLFSGNAAAMTGSLNMNDGNLAFEGTGSLNSGLNVVLGTAAKNAELLVGTATAAATTATIGGLSNGSFTGSRVIGGNATTSTLILGSTSGSHTYSGALGGVGTNENNFNLVKDGAGTQILNGTTITYSGTTTVREGTLQLGAAAVFAPTGALSVIADSGATATMDFNGKNYTTVGVLTLGGGANGVANVADTAVTKGLLTLGGDVVYDAANNPGAATISSNLATGARTITVNNSTNAATDLTISGTIAATGGITLAGAGNGAISGAWTLTGTNLSNTFNSTGTWDFNATTTTTGTGDWNINSGTINANVSNALNATDNVIIDGTGTQGSAIVNIGGTAGTSGIHQGNNIFIRNGAQINVGVANGISTGTNQLLIGDASSNSAAAAGLLNYTSNVNISTTAGLQLGAAGGQTGNITGTGTFTSAGTKDLRNGSIGSGITLAGNGAITKQAIGTVTFSGERAAASTGATNIFEGTLILDYTTNNNSKIGGVLNLGQLNNVSNGTLQLNGNNGAATTQSVTSTTIAAGNNTVTINNGTGQTATLNLGAISRSTAAGAGVLSLEYLSSSSKATSTSAAGTLGYASLSIGGGVERFAAIDGSGDIVQATLTTENNVANWLVGQNIINSGNFTGAVDCADISSLTFDAGLAATLSLTSTGHLRISSGGIMVDSGIGAFNQTITGGSLVGATNSGIAGEIIVHQNNTLGNLTIASKIINSAGVTKTGLGTLVLSGANSFLHTGSQLTINEGTVQLANGSAIGDTTAVYMRQGTTLNLSNSNEVVGHLVSESNGTIAMGTGDLTLNQTTNSTYRGLFTGIAGAVLTVNSLGFNFNITGASTGYAGTVVLNSGLLQLSGASGHLNAATSFTINKTGTLLLDNNDDTTFATRILDTAAIILNSADGVFSTETIVRGLTNRENDDANSNETYGTLTLNSGANYVSLEASGGANAQAGLIAATSWTRSNNATINVRGRSLGATADAAGRAQFKVADANDAAMLAANVGGGGTIGGTAKNVSIIPWAIGENLTAGLAATNMGNTFLSYVDNRGFVPLNLTNEFSTFGTVGGATDNVRENLAADLTGLTTQTINSLIINRNVAAAGTTNVAGSNTGGQILTNTSGAFLFTLNTTATASSAHVITLGGYDGGIQVGATNEYVMHVVNPSSATNTATLTTQITSPLNTVAAALTKSGRGTLELTAVNTYTGGSNVNEGTLLIHDMDNIGPSGAVNLAGGTLRIASDFADDLGGRNMVVREGGGTLQVDAASVTSTDLVVSGSGTLNKTGTGTLRIAGGTANTHTGIVNVNQGLIELNKTAGVNAISGSTLNIGGAGQNATVTLLAANQIANTTAVSVTSTGVTAMGTLNLNNNAETIASLTMNSSTVQGVLVTTGASGVLTVNGDITLNNNRNVNDASSNARNIVITGTGSIGTPAPNTGTLNLGGATRTITVQTTASGTSLGNLDATIETTITNGGVIKAGSRALILSGNNTYTGGTSVTNGELNLRGGSLAAGAVVVNKEFGSLTNAAVLSGTGTIAGATTIGENNCGVGILAPGSIASTTTLVSNYGAGANGSLTFTASGTALTVANGSQIQFGLTAATHAANSGVIAALAAATYGNALTYITAFSPSWIAGAPVSSTQHDFISLTNGSLDLGTRSSATAGAGTISISNLGYLTGAQNGDIFNLIDWVGAMGGSFNAGPGGFTAGGVWGDFDLPTLSGGLFWDTSAFTSHGVIVVVPEPGRALLVLLGLMALFFRRRRD